MSLNFSELAERIGLDESDYRELVELFVETGMADYSQLKTALDDGDNQQVARSAHTISGASGNLGLMQVHEVAKRVERAASEGHLDNLPADVATLKALLDDIAQFMVA
ncbi:putative Hpt domain protein [Desulfosarcina cetonica]|uniref:Hpt domain-containing protein n=1 Tax=Desulfosarcina cetonica TaxID=90730 RepID=UPI0006CFFCA0|nr:Hpt domain-containing protein [Desulfosarcina cetonica]VTR69831.1 putative Hpt domain protein [Desulfosarcina cetonica]